MAIAAHRPCTSTAGAVYDDGCIRVDDGQNQQMSASGRRDRYRANPSRVSAGSVHLLDERDSRPPAWNAEQKTHDEDECQLAEIHVDVSSGLRPLRLWARLGLVELRPD